MPPAKKKDTAPAVAEASAEEAARAAEAAAAALRAEQARDLVEAAAREAAAEMRECALVEREVPHAARAAVAQLVDLVGLAFLRADRGESAAEAASASWRLSQRQGPAPAALDNWARGAIPSKRRVRASRDSVSSLPQKLPSVSGGKARSVGSKVKSTVRSASRNSTSEDKRQRGKQADYLVKLDELDMEAAAGRGASAKAAAAAEKERQKALAEIEDKRREAEEARKARAAEAEAEAARASELADELKGKDFSLGEDGKIIIIERVNADKLPVKRADMDHAVVDGGATEPELEERGGGGGDDALPGGVGGGGGAGAKGKGAKAKALKELKTTPNTEFFRATESFQQSVLKNPALDIQPGVSIKEGAAGRSGPPHPEDGAHMSKETFVAHQRMLEVTVGGGSSLATPASKLKANAPAASTAAKPTALAAAAATGAAATGAQAPASAATPTTKSPAPRSPSPGHEEDGPATNTAGLLPAETGGAEQEPVDPNLEMVKASTWGQNRPAKEFVPAVLPAKAEAAGGPEPSPVRPARLRPTVETSGKHLPAPILSPTSGSPVSASAEFNYVSRFDSTVNAGSITVASDRARRALGMAEAK
jgi:colicin import membrane protein